MQFISEEEKMDEKPEKERIDAIRKIAEADANYTN